MNDIGGLLDAYGLLALAVVILLKEAGAPIPIPGDVLVLVAGARAATGAFGLPELILLLTIAALAGAVVQYFLARGPARAVLYRYGRFLGLTSERLDRATGAIGRRGWRGVAVARLTPGVRSVSVIACGLAAMPLRRFLPGILVGSTLFFALHAILGFVVGPAALSILQGLNLPILPLLVVVLVVGLGLWLLRRRRRAAAVVEWADAGCPLCSVAGLITRLEVQSPVRAT